MGFSGDSLMASHQKQFSELTELVEKLDSMGLHFGMEVDKIMAEEG